MKKLIRNIYATVVLVLTATSAITAQTYYEIQYEQLGYTLNGLMIYNGDAEPIWMRFIQRDSEKEFIDIWTYTDMQMTYSQDTKWGTYSLFSNKDKYAIKLVCMLDKSENGKAFIVPSADELKDKSKWIKCSYFSEVDLKDMDEEFCLKYFRPQADREMYNKIIKAHKLVCESEQQVMDNLGNGFEIYRYFYEAKHTELSPKQARKNLTSREREYNKDIAVTHPTLAKRIDKRIDAQEATYTAQANSTNNNTSFNKPSTQSVTSLDGSTIHLMIVANSDIADIGSSCKIDLANMQNEIQGIGQALGVPVHQYIVSGSDYSVDGVVAKLEEMNPSPNDIVIFLYSGHGFRFSDQTDAYPNMVMTTSSYQRLDGNYISVSDIYELITSKGGRLNIVLSDCCNADLGERRPINTNSLGSRGNNNYSLDRLKKLFMARGSLISTAAGPNEVSWCDNAGGMFTLSFIRSLRNEISATNTGAVSWDNVINNTLVSASKRSKSICKTAQNGLKYVKMVK